MNNLLLLIDAKLYCFFYYYLRFKLLTESGSVSTQGTVSFFSPETQGHLRRPVCLLYSPKNEPQFLQNKSILLFSGIRNGKKHSGQQLSKKKAPRGEVAT